VELNSAQNDCFVKTLAQKKEVKIKVSLNFASVFSIVCSGSDHGFMGALKSNCTQNNHFAQS
jgi:hypothetical protein